MRQFINKILNVPRLILTIWIMLWAILAILLIMKFLFGIWYPIVVENETLLKGFDYIDNHKWLSTTIMGIFYVVSLNLLCLTNLGKAKYDNIVMLLMVNALIITAFFIKNYNSIAGNIFEIIMLFLSCSVYNYFTHSFDRRWKDILVPIINYGLLNLWQLTMLVIRNVDGLVLSDMPSLIYIVLQLDYYIFITISWIGVSIMGLLSAGWFWSKDITVLKAEKEKELAKKEPDMKLVAKIDSRIAELEKEGK